MTVAPLRVLVVDDEPFVRDTVAMLLTLEGHTVFSAADGAAGLLLAQQQQPDVILTDRFMPQLDGDGLLAAVRADPALTQIRVVLLTGDTEPPARTGHDTGLRHDACLVKPFSRAQLLSALAAGGPG